MAIQSDANYVWGTGATEQQRLLQQIELYTPQASWLLDHLKIKSGSRAIDLGCGLLGILDLLSEKVGTEGEVMGVEWESRFVETAKELLAERKIKNVRVIAGDATSTQLPSHSFQFVHERLLLIVVPEPARVISEMVRLTANAAR
jgi:ubiquinone/menaquinone biosynthesis C-methylase UbiE